MTNPGRADKGPSIALSDFWQSFWDDGGLNSETLSAFEAYLAGAYQRLLKGALGVSVESTPAWYRSYFRHFLLSKADRRSVVEDGETWHYFPLDDDIIDLQALQNAPVRPTVVYERDVHLGVVTRQGVRRLRLRVDPFDDPSLSRRIEQRPATDLLEGIDGVVEFGSADADLPDPDSDPEGYSAAVTARYLTRRTFSTAGVLRVIRDCTYGVVNWTDLFAGDDVFELADAGRQLRVYAPTLLEVSIVEVLSPRRVRLSGPLSATALTLDAAVVEPAPFDAGHVGFTLYLEHPALEEATGDYRIVEVLDANTVLLDTAVIFNPDDVADAEALRYVLKTPRYVEAVRLWAVDPLVDPSDLSVRWGQLVGKQRPSSSAYRSFLRGAMLFFWTGPTVRAIRALLNLSAGLPVIATADEVLTRVDAAGSQSVVTTSVSTYVLRTDLLRPELLDPSNWGRYTFSTFEHLSPAFEVVDASINPTWLYGLSLPERVVDGTPAQRRITPGLTPTRLDGAWRIGDPGVFIEADVDGDVTAPLVHRGTDAFWFDDLSPDGALRFVQEPVAHRYAPRYAYVEDRAIRTAYADTTTDVLGVVGAVADLVTYVSGSVVDDELTASSTTELVQWRDEGRWLLIGGQYYKIDRVLSSTTGRLVDGAGAPASLPALGATWPKSLRYAIVERAPMTAHLGFKLALLAAPNVFGLVYDAEPFVDVLSVLQGDIMDLIDKGRPVWAQLVSSPTWGVLDVAVSVDESDAVLEFPLHAVASTRDVRRLGDGGSLSDYFFFADQPFEERFEFDDMQLDTDPPLDGAVLRAGCFDGRNATSISVRLFYVSADPVLDVTFDVYQWDGAALDDVLGSWVLTASTGLVVSNDFVPVAVPELGEVLRFVVTNPATALYTLAVSAERDSVVEWRTAGHLPASDKSGASLGVTTEGSDLLEAEVSANSSFWRDLDEGRVISLVYPAVPSAGLSQHADVVRVVEVVDWNQVRVVDDSTGSTYSAPRSSSDVAWRLGPQQAWGQTPRRLYTPPALTQWDNEVTSRLGRASDVAVGLSVVSSAAATLRAVALSDYMRHVFAYDPTANPLSDDGTPGGSDGSVTAGVVNYAPTGTGSLGHMRVETSAVSTGFVSAANVNTARTADCWFECVISFPEAPPAGSLFTLFELGAGTATGGFCLVRWYSATDNVRILNASGGSTLMILTGLDKATLQAGPVQLLLYWEHAAATWHALWNAGAGETEVTAAATVGSGSVSRSLTVGYSATQASALMACHFMAFHRGPLTARHRARFDAARGL